MVDPGGVTIANKNYGWTQGGKLITEELLEKLVQEAEEGFDVEAILEKRAGRPPMGFSAASAASVESVRLEPELSEAFRERAEYEGRTNSELIRGALRR
jgi:hypothetical protein